jgi:dipeptidyl aminopeptidase/acylaminoacyl peptidase
MSRSSILLALAVLGLMPAVTVRADQPPLIPRKVLFGNPTKASPEISPDGKHLSFLAPDDRNVLQVWVRTVGKDDAHRVTDDKKRGIRIHAWAFAPDTLLYMQDHDGDENFHVYAVHVQTAKTRDLTPFEGVRAQIAGLDRHHPGELLVTMNKRDPRAFDVYRVDLKSGEAKLDTKNPGDVVSWEADPDFRVRVAQAATPDGGMEVRWRPDEKSEWKTAVKWGPEDADGEVVGFTADGKSLWLKSSEGRDTLAIVKRELESGKEEVIATDPHADAGGVIFNPLTHQVEAVAFNRERVHWKALDPKVGEDLEVLLKANEGEPAVTSRDRDLQTWVVAFTSDVRSQQYFVYDRKDKKLTSY